MNVANKQAGFSLLEVLTGISILLVMSLGVAQSSIMSLSTYKRTVRHSLAQQLAIEKLEEFAHKNPTTYDASDSATENNLIESYVKFDRTTTITVGADGSRTVLVTVVAAKSDLGGYASYQSNFPLWGQQ